METNPFKIEEGKPLETASKSSKIVTFLTQTIASMTVDKNKSFFIPAATYSTPHAARSAVNSAKKVLRESIASMSDCEFTVRTIRDEDKNYLGLRVWRIN